MIEFTGEKYVNLHNHSYYSALDGLSSPDDMVDACIANGSRALAITDHGTCGGWYNFQKACLAKGVKPILGNEFYISPDHTSVDPKDPRYHLVLLAKNHLGVQNIMELSTIAETKGKYKKPRIDFKLLQAHHEGLICMSACCIGELPSKLWQGENDGAVKMANEYKDLFGDDYYIEIMMHKYNQNAQEQEKREKVLAKQLYSLAKKLNIKTVCSNDAHYANRSDAPYHDVMLSMQTHDHIKNPDRFTFNGEQFYLRPYEEMYDLYKSAPEMLLHTVEIAEKIESDAILLPSKDLLPIFNVPQGVTSETAYLKELVKEGMKLHGFINDPIYRERIKMEMELIVRCGFVRYFLTLWDIINYAKQQAIRVGVGRGCFIPETKVQCKLGLKSIKDVTLEDEVLAYDGKYHEVTNLLDYDIDEEIVEIEAEDGRKISCTLDHKIHVKRNGILVFVEAGNLTENDEIFDIEGKTAKINKITRRKYKGKVHDLTVPDLSSYNVEGLSVHNSGAGSLCLYCLGVTKLDPLKYDLLFERFINPERVSPPDVDIDFDYVRRDEIFEYIIRKYGTDYCCKIGTYNTFKAKGAIRYAAKALDIGNDWETYQAAKKRNPKAKIEMTKKSLDLADFIAKQIPEVPGTTIESALKDDESFRSAMQKYPKLLDAVRHVENTVSSAGVHPAGIIICKDPIAKHIPLRESKGAICSQFVMSEVDELGLLKLDMLAIKTLTVIEDTIQMIKKRYGIDIDIDNLEPTDKNIFKLFNGGYKNMDNRGVFQFEAHGISKLLKSIRVDTFNDLVVCNALYRPGPLGAGVHELYSDYKHGKKKIEYLHPKMGEVLGETYGIMCFSKDQIVYTNNGPKCIEEICKQPVYCIDNGKLNKYTSVNGAFKSGVREIFEYTLSNGAVIKSTNDHPIFNGEDYIAMDEVFYKKLPIHYTLGNINNSTENVKMEKQAYLWGALIGDGTTKASTPILCVGKNKSYGEMIINLFSDVYGEDCDANLFFATRSWYVRFSFKSNSCKWGTNKTNQLKNELESMNLRCLSIDKFLPFDSLKPNRRIYLSLLAGLVDTDGSIQKDIYYSSSSKQLLIDVEYVLWRLGYTTYRSHHMVHVYESIDLFNELKPYLINKKGVNSLSCNGGNIRLNSKMVAELLKNKIGNMSVRKFCEINKLNRCTVMRIMSQKNTWCKKGGVERVLNKDEINACKCLFVERRKSLGMQDVYDLSMPHDDHNFIVNSGVSVHNCFQENIMKVVQVLAGFTLGQADWLRKVIGKKKPELIKKENLDNLFIEGCKKYSDIDTKVAKAIFDQIEYFGGYGFNKCLSGDTEVINEIDGRIYRLDELEDLFFRCQGYKEFGIGDLCESPSISIKSLKNGDVINDQVVDVFEVGVRELFEVELDNGFIIKCTMDHKFICSDGEKHELKEIIEKDLEILCESGDIKVENMQKCKIKSVKYIGKQMTYSVEMAGDQHNYKIVNKRGGGVYTANSHAACYSMIAYQTAWLKVYYPLEYMCNLLSSEINNSDKGFKLNSYISEARRMNLVIKGADINKSGLKYSIASFRDEISGEEKDGIRTPLTILNGVGEKAVESIVANQPFANLKEFLHSVDTRKVTSRVFTALVENGCMRDSWGIGDEALLNQYVDVKAEVDKEKKQKKKKEEQMDQYGGASIFSAFGSEGFEI